MRHVDGLRVYQLTHLLFGYGRRGEHALRVASVADRHGSRRVYLTIPTRLDGAHFIGDDAKVCVPSRPLKVALGLV